MTLSWLSVVPQLVPLVIRAVRAVEIAAADKPGAQKQDAAMAIVRDAATAPTAGAVCAPLIEPDVDAAIRALIDAYVAVENVVAKKRGAMPAV